MGIGIGIYVKNSKEAVELYCNVFGLELGYHVLNEDGNYFHSELLKHGAPLATVVMDKYGARWYVTLPQYRPIEEV